MTKEIGELLKKQRRELSKSIDDIVKELRIKRQAIIDIENNNYDPKDIYIKGYIRLYANHIGVVIEQVIQTRSLPGGVGTNEEQLYNPSRQNLGDVSDMPSQVVVLLSLLVAIVSFVAIYLLRSDHSNDALLSNIKYLQREQKQSEEVLAIINEDGSYVVHYKEGYEFFVKGLDSSEVKILDINDQPLEQFYLRIGEVKQLKIKEGALVRSNVPHSIEVHYNQVPQR